MIEDEIPLRTALRRALEGAGHDVLEAGDGVEASLVAAREPVDVVLTDLIMPNRDGIETILWLRRRHPGIKVIAMSGGGRTQNLDFLAVARDIGVAQTLAKPFRKSALLDAVDAAIEGRAFGSRRPKRCPAAAGSDTG
ncbi:MAG: response regulator [Rhodospirillales bacterium]|nr:response regulator [Rhodospirillales bacterium]